MRLLFQSVGIFAISLAQCGNGVAAAPSVLTGHQILRHATVAVPKISGLFLRCLVASWHTCMSHGAGLAIKRLRYTWMFFGIALTAMAACDMDETSTDGFEELGEACQH